MKTKQKQKTKLPPFFPVFIETVKSPAWLAISYDARSLYVQLKQRYNRKEQKAVYLSRRTAAKELGANKDTIGVLYRELRHFGFIVQVQAARFGGKGEAARYRLADEPYLGQPPGMDFTRWRGAVFRRGLSDRTGQAVRQDRTGLSDGVGQRPQFPSKSPVRRRRTNLEEDSSHLA